jgi:hypothetical protein
MASGIGRWARIPLPLQSFLRANPPTFVCYSPYRSIARSFSATPHNSEKWDKFFSSLVDKGMVLRRMKVRMISEENDK